MKLKTSLVATVATLLVAGTALAQATLPYGLKSGKPYAGTKVTVLSVETPQFQGVQLRDREFTDMTGIEVEWNFTPFKALQEKIASTGAAVIPPKFIGLRSRFMRSWPTAVWG